MRQRDFLTRETNLMVLFGLSGVAIGWLTQNALDQATGGKNFWLALAPLSLPVLLVMVMRPVVAAVLVVGFAFVNTSLLPPLVEFGQLSFRYVDGVFALSICMVLARLVIQRRVVITSEFRYLLTPLLLFFFYIGLSLVIVRFSAPNFLDASIASYMRLVLTACFAVVLQLALRDKWDIHFFHKALIGLSIASVGLGTWLLWAGFEHGASTGLEGRFGGMLGTASFGLVSGLLVLYAIIKRDDKSRHSAMWIGPFIVGLFGLFLAKSAISIFAAAGAVSVYFATMRFRRSKIEGLLRGAAVGTILMIAAALMVSNVRRSDVSELGDISGGSFAERLMFGYAGLQIFLDHPVIGVGWQASTAAAVIDTPALREALKEKFSHLPAHYFLKPPSQIHNMYIQFLTELGLVGFTLFVWVCCRIGKRVTQILKNLPTDSPYRVWAQFDALALIFLLIWWNGNPLFGGQIETILAFTFLALLANLAQLERQSVEQFAVANRKI